MPFQIVEGDITKQRVGAIVNAANTGLQMGGGVCGAIFRAAGEHELQAECNTIGSIETGDAVITKGYALPADYIIHTAGPIWSGGDKGEEELLRSCYKNSLALAEANGIDSVAFPLISSGIYGYPRREALEVAENAIRDYLADSNSDMEVSLVLRRRDDLPAKEELLEKIQRYLQILSEPSPGARRVVERFNQATPASFVDIEDEAEPEDDVIVVASALAKATEFKEPEIEVKETEEQFFISGPYEGFAPKQSFVELLRGILIKSDIEKDSDIYKRANITKDVWSKIFSKKDHIPSKRTAVAIAVALRMNLDQTQDLIKAAGYVLTNSFVFDQIIIYCINNEVFDVYSINEILFKYEQPLLGSFSN